MKPIITIEYCPKCGWLLRAAYIAQELLTSFTQDIHGVILVPSITSGKFVICVDDKTIFNRKQYGGFAEIKRIKQWVRDKINPDKSLGHIDD